MTINKTKIAILVGAGAVENAWTPVLNVFKIIYGNEIDADSVNFLFAKSVCALRLYSKSPKGAIQLKEEQDLVSIMKELIAEQLKHYQKAGILRPRKEFSAILDKFIFSNPHALFGFVSTNWDTIIDAEVNRWVKEQYYNIESAKVFHIHGSIEAHEHLYLPSETSMENYRSDEENHKVGYGHFTMCQFLSEANVIILYGISLDPLDAELNLLLSGAFTKGKTIREVIIINPDYQTIRKRVKILLFPRNDITIRCFKPQNLDIEL